MRRKMPPPLFVDAIEIGMFQQPRQTGRATRKVCSGNRRVLFYTPLRSVGRHQLTILHDSYYDSYDDRY